jgi:hypothetical protein
MTSGPAGGHRDVTLVQLTGGRPDLAVVDALARLALAVRRSGGRLEVVQADGPLASLIERVGLADALGPPAGNGDTPLGRPDP